MTDESVFENALHPLRFQPIYQYRLFGVLYHGVSKSAEPEEDGRQFCYSAGVMVLLQENPQTHLSPEPVLTPESPEELRGTIANVVFQAGIDLRDDLGTPDRFDVYYGVADSRIGVASLSIPKDLPIGALADAAPTRNELIEV